RDLAEGREGRSRPFRQHALFRADQEDARHDAGRRRIRSAGGGRRAARVARADGTQTLGALHHHAGAGLALADGAVAEALAGPPDRAPLGIGAEGALSARDYGISIAPEINRNASTSRRKAASST